jgi:hypothetical protein
MINTRVGAFSLVLNGMKAESIIDDKVWMYRTHFPFTKPHDQPFNKVLMANKTIICVRNPLDATVSQVQLLLTDTHTSTLKNDPLKDLPELWDSFV